MFEIAHQEIIQKPKYILNCWAPILESLKVFSYFQSIKGVENMYDAEVNHQKGFEINSVRTSLGQGTTVLRELKKVYPVITRRFTSIFTVRHWQ